MQWTDGKNGGFSRAAPGRLVAKPPADGYAPDHVNVQQQRNDDSSLLQFIRHLISRYRASAEIGWGELRILEHEAPGVLAHAVVSDVGGMIAVHNFTDVPVRVTLSPDFIGPDTELLDLFGPENVAVDARGRVDLEVPAYGFRWLRASPPGDTRIG
jgi:hypothetical protein